MENLLLCVTRLAEDSSRWWNLYVTRVHFGDNVEFPVSSVPEEYREELEMLWFLTKNQDYYTISLREYERHTLIAYHGKN